MTIWMLDEESPDNNYTRFWQSTPYLSVVLWSYSEKYSGKVQYLPQFCSQLSELIDRPNKLLFSASILECLPLSTNGEKKNSWDWLGFSNTIRSDKAGTDMVIKAKKIDQETFFSSESIIEHLTDLKKNV